MGTIMFILFLLYLPFFGIALILTKEYGRRHTFSSHHIVRFMHLELDKQMTLCEGKTHGKETRGFNISGA